MHQPLAGAMQGGLKAWHERDCLAVGVQGWVTTVPEPNSLSTSVYRINRWDQQVPKASLVKSQAPSKTKEDSQTVKSGSEDTVPNA